MVIDASPAKTSASKTGGLHKVTVYLVTEARRIVNVFLAESQRFWVCYGNTNLDGACVTPLMRVDTSERALHVVLP
jgi:hypothetical protein